MAQDLVFNELMDRLRGGDQDAAREIFTRFANRLIGLARTRLDPPTRQKVDSEDVVQSVFRSFFARYADGQFDLGNWDNLWSMLTVITLRKCGHHIEHFHAACRDVQRELAAPPVTDDSHRSWQAIAREPMPSEAAMLAELVEQLMNRLDERERQMLSLSLQGYSVPEISAQVDRTERTVQRVLERVRKRLARMRAGDVEAT